MAEDLLYGICIEVNPSLEINCVNLRTAATEHTKPAPKKLRKDDPLRRLGQVTRDLERQLKSRVHGQDAAVESLCSAVRKAAAGLSAPNQLDITSCLPVRLAATGKTQALPPTRPFHIAPDGNATVKNLISLACSEFSPGPGCTASLIV